MPGLFRPTSLRMMLLNDLRDPAADFPSGAVRLDAAVQRALEEAREPEGQRARVEWRFYVLEEETAASLAWLAARGIEDRVGPDGARAAYEQWRAIPGWVVVTCARHAKPEDLERAREAARTAAQRASLSLWSNNVPSKWDQDIVADAPAFFDLIGGEPEREIPVGVLLYGHAERGP